MFSIETRKQVRGINLSSMVGFVLFYDQGKPVGKLCNVLCDALVLFSLILRFTLLLPLVLLRRFERQGKYFLLFQNSCQ